MHECGFSRTLNVARMYEKTNLIKVSTIHYLYTTPNFSSIRSERLSDPDSDSDTYNRAGHLKVVGYVRRSCLAGDLVGWWASIASDRVIQRFA